MHVDEAAKLSHEGKPEYLDKYLEKSAMLRQLASELQRGCSRCSTSRCGARLQRCPSLSSRCVSKLVWFDPTTRTTPRTTPRTTQRRTFRVMILTWTTEPEPDLLGVDAGESADVLVQLRNLRSPWRDQNVVMVSRVTRHVALIIISRLWSSGSFNIGSFALNGCPRGRLAVGGLCSLGLYSWAPTPGFCAIAP
jgi:hypothetical protein